jgi:hypothetical protein
VPVGVAAAEPSHPGLIQGIIAIVCAVISLLLLPPLFGIAGIILGVLSLRKGHTALGIVAIVLSAVFMVLGMAFGVYIANHPEFLKHPSSSTSSTSGAIIESLLQE